MNFKRICAFVCALTIGLTVSGCANNKTAVYVQSVEVLNGLGGIGAADQFSGIVEAESVSSVQKDGTKTILELLVSEGDDVTEGQPLFSYDTEEIQLNLDKQRLELEQLLSSIESYNDQIATLEKSLNTVNGSTKLQYTIEIQSIQLNLKEAQLNIKTKETEIKKSENLLENATVTAPVTGRIQSISEGETDRYGNPLPYISIQKTGAYRVKGVLGELQRGGIMEGDRLTIHDRIGGEKTWSGTVTRVDYDNPYRGSENSDYYYMGSSDEMGSSSKYAFYVQLDNLDGLLLGQHVYLEREVEEGSQPKGPCISSAFVCYDEDGSTYVWVEESRKLAKRPVTLGEYNPMTDSQEITEGLSLSDYIAFPDPELCQEGVPVTRNKPAAEESLEEGEVA